MPAKKTARTMWTVIFSGCIGTLLSLSGLIACETASTAPGRNGEPRVPVLPVPAARATQGTGTILIATEFQGVDAPADLTCRWRMQNTETGKSFFVEVKGTGTMTWAQMDPGHYKTGRLGCGFTRVWDIDNLFKEGFFVERGHVSYIGKLTFVFKGDELDVVKKASRADSAKAFAAAFPGGDSDTQLVRADGSVVEAISAFTEKPLERRMLQNAESQDGFDVYANGLEDASKALSPLVSHLQTCASQESSVDPLRFGRLEYVAIYKQGRFSEMKDRQEMNAFSDRLRSCVERGIMAFHPNAKRDIEVRVRY